MRIIPVLDILNGKVIHGIRGERKKYKPIKSVITKSSNPLKVAETFKNKFGLNEIYIADLDSIMRKGDNSETINKIKKKLMMKIMVDFGVRSIDDLDKEIIKIVDEVIIGTETLESLKVLEKAIKLIGNERIIVSIDMKNMKIVSKSKELRTPEQTVKKIWNLGIKKFILLDLKKTGSMEGQNKKLEKLIKKLVNFDLYLITGGGIKSVEDIIELKKIGIRAALIATSLHNGKIRKMDIDKI
ncbi:MAG: HisA/HisF family protein [Actinobacteria bacterium]|nr:HisA/HisF family protein [Actinomycetota bacterium]